MKRIGFGVVFVAILGVVYWRLSPTEPEEARESPVVSAREPLEYDEPVRMRWVDEETGEDEVWTVTKLDGRLDVDTDRGLPEVDPNPSDHVPDESSRALSAMGLEAWRAGEVVEAMDSLSAAIDADPDDPLPRTQYGRLLALSMSYNDALVHLERAAELNPDDPQVWLDLLTVHEKSLDLDLAWEARRRAETLAEGREIRQAEMGFWVLGDQSIYP
jgi:hypothetical protein